MPLPSLDRRTLFAASAAGAVLGVTECRTAEAHPAGRSRVSARLSVGKVLARDLVVPWGVAFLPDGDALVGERPSGNVHVVHHDGGRTFVGQIPGVADAGEGGLLGIALDPDFDSNTFAYFYLTTDSDNRIVRYTYAGGQLADETVLLPGLPRGSGPGGGRHNGGRLAFGPDKMLYASVGDTGVSASPPDQNPAQDPHKLAGKILRLNPVDGSGAPGNPFEDGVNGNPRVWTYGHRNVEGLAWDGRGRMWASELGENVRDELNIIEPGRNYGWPYVEGGDGPGPYADPFVTWKPTDICSPSGVAVAHGKAWVGALHGECLWSVRLGGPHAGRKVRHFHHAFGRIRTVQKAPDGSLWITTSNQDGRGNPAAHDDRVIRIDL